MINEPSSRLCITLAVEFNRSAKMETFLHVSWLLVSFTAKGGDLLGGATEMNLLNESRTRQVE